MSPADTQSLKDAVARSGPAVLSLPSAGQLRHHRTRFLLPSLDQDGFWIEAPAAERELIEALRAGRKPVGVSLRGGAGKVSFATVIREFEPALPLGDQAVVDALLLAWPDQVQAIQRRADYRVTVQPADVADVRLRVWRIPDHHHLRDRPSATALLKVTLGDLSVGGMGLLYTPDADDPKLAEGQRLRVTLGHATTGDDELLLDARVRHARPLPGDCYRLGVQFKKLEDDIEGRQALATLTQIVGLLQRSEIRRKRLELSRKTA
jgi:c-di-GMP-binding flagellar brake protein YcgR